MKLSYEEPIIEIRKYSLSLNNDIMTTSEPDIDNPDPYPDLFQ